MIKTNLRINNFFIVMKKKDNSTKYYLSDIDEINTWKNTSNKLLKDYMKNDVTDKICKLLQENNVSSNVNFIESNKESSKNVIVHKSEGG
tara:strand:+ start:270 stop:539 length:270 start_codon:yes stop_codon:yes gene_type:complete